MKINIRFDNRPPKASKKHDQFIVDWNKKLGWSNDPFSENLKANIRDYIGGYETERMKINLFVLQRYNFGVLSGDSGMGKTTILKWMLSELKKYKQKIIAGYIDGNKMKGPLSCIKEVINPVENIFEKLIIRPHKELDLDTLIPFIRRKLRNKRLILLIDDIGKVSDFGIELLKKMFKSSLNMQLIIAGTKDEIATSEIKDLIAADHLHIELKSMKYEDFKDMVSARIELVGGKGTQPFTDAVLQMIQKECKGNPQIALQMLHSCATEFSLKKWYSGLKELAQNEEKVLKDLEAEERELRGVDTGKDEKSNEGDDSLSARARRKNAESELNDFFSKVKSKLGDDF